MTNIPNLLTRFTTNNTARNTLLRLMGRPLHSPHLINLMDAAVTETLNARPTLHPEVITSGYARFHTTASPKQALDFYAAMLDDPHADAARTWALHEVYDRITKAGRVVGRSNDGFPVIDCNECGARHDVRLGHCEECMKAVEVNTWGVCSWCALGDM